MPKRPRRVGVAERPYMALRRLCGLGSLFWLSGCVDKAPPPLWPAPPPPAVAELLGEPEKRPAPMPSAVVGASVLAGPPSKLDKLPADKSSILDPEGAAATAAAQADPPGSPRPVPTHR